jgi:hypothetical protein
VSLRDEVDLSTLSNAVENWVIDILEVELENWPQIRDNHENILDVMAYALNQIKPQYYVTLLGNLYAQSPTEEQLTEVREAVLKALTKISQDI